MRRRFSCIVWSLVAACVVLGSRSLAAEEGEPSGGGEVMPRYQFSVGQELVYEGTAEVKYGESDASTSRSSWKIWVVRQNDDGGWRLILRATQSSGPKGAVVQESSSLGYCDLAPDGRIKPNPTLSFQLYPRWILPRLPDDAVAAGSKWEELDEAFHDRHLYTLRPGEATGQQPLVIEDVKQSAMNDIYLATWNATFFFDRDRGLVERIETASTQGYGFNSKGTGEIRLKSSESHDADQARRLSEDLDAYLAATEAYDSKFRPAAKNSQQADALMAQALDELRQAADRLASPVFTEELTSKLKQHEAMVKYANDQARVRAAVVDHPAAGFETTDLDGKEHSLADYRGRVVVLDFWYRGCGWCIRAMPQVNELARSYAGKPVAILGMNTDQNLEDAQFVVEKMGLIYANLKAAGIPEKYQVQAFPTLIVIDQQGTVRDIHIGYSPTLAHEVSQTIDSLLSTK